MMGGIGGSANLRIMALRGGTASEMIEFLTDLQNAYNSLYSFFWTEFAFIEREIFIERASRYIFDGDRPRLRNTIFNGGYFELLLDKGSMSGPVLPEQISPEYILEISRISIQSPGFWEVIGGLNPLQQLRGYLDERHKRRQDIEYREQSEKEKLKLEQQLLEEAVRDRHIDRLRKEVELMKDVKIDKEAIRQVVWQRLGPPLAALGRHQDRKLIGAPMNNPEDDQDSSDGR